MKKDDILYSNNNKYVIFDGNIFHFDNEIKKLIKVNDKDFTDYHVGQIGNIKKKLDRQIQYDEEIDYLSKEQYFRGVGYINAINMDLYKNQQDINIDVDFDLKNRNLYKTIFSTLNLKKIVVQQFDYTNNVLNYAKIKLENNDEEIINIELYLLATEDHVVYIKVFDGNRNNSFKEYIFDYKNTYTFDRKKETGTILPLENKIIYTQILDYIYKSVSFQENEVKEKEFNDYFGFGIITDYYNQMLPQYTIVEKNIYDESINLKGFYLNEELKIIQKDENKYYFYNNELYIVNESSMVYDGNNIYRIDFYNKELNLLSKSEMEEILYEIETYTMLINKA